MTSEPTSSVAVLDEGRNMGATEPAVMIIDDDDHLREAVSLLLEDHGYDVHRCADARDALNQLAQGASPDVILLDLMMPHMDGWEFRIEQRRDAKWANIPVVALSADASAKARAIDAQAYLSKPVDDAVLLRTVGQLVHALAAARMREQLSAPDAQDSLSALAERIVQEVNSPLSTVMGSLELAQSKAEEVSARLAANELRRMIELRRMLSRSQRGAERISAVVRSVTQPDEPPPSHEAGAPAEGAVDRTSAQRRLSLLVVDDEPMMCELIVALLTTDYDVVAYTDPRAALEALLAGSFDLVLCDLMMPQLTGMDLYERVSAERPELAQRFVFMSGGAFTERARTFFGTVRRPQVHKPFRRQDVIEALEAQRALLH
jgi:CheY-like chemotaxis protein